MKRGRLLPGVAGLVVLGAVTLPSARVSAAASTPAGLGHAVAQTFQIDPRTAGLAYQVTFGASLADHANKVARAQAQIANFGIIGTAVTAPDCHGDPAAIRPEQLPQPVRVDSRDAGADEGKSETNGPFNQSARASARPFADSSTTIAPLDLGGIITFLGGRSQSTSGLDSKDNPQATAEVKVGGVSFLGGLVELQGLHWKSGSRPDKGDDRSFFSIESVTIGGVPVRGSDPRKLLEAANVALRPFGFAVSAPKVHTANNTTFVDPLRVAIVPSAQRDALVRPVISGAQPIREAVFQFLLDRVPCQYSAAAAILVADIVTLSLTGGGSMGFNVGGTSAQTRVLDAVSTGFDLGGTRPSTELPNLSATGAGTYAVPDPSVLGDDTNAVFDDSGSGAGAPGTRPAQRAAARRDDNDNAKWVALAVIGLGAVLVEGELRLRRRAAAGGVS